MGGGGRGIFLRGGSINFLKGKRGMFRANPHKIKSLLTY